MSCRFCGSEKIGQVNAKCSDLFSAKLPGRQTWSNGYNFIPGLMASGDNDYVEFDVCLACQRIQGDLFEYVDKPASGRKAGKKVWTLREKLNDLYKRAHEVTEYITFTPREPGIDELTNVVERLQAVDRCLPGLVRDLEKATATTSRAREGKVRIRRSAASAAELTLADTKPDHYEIIDD